MVNELLGHGVISKVFVARLPVHAWRNSPEYYQCSEWGQDKKKSHNSGFYHKFEIYTKQKIMIIQLIVLFYDFQVSQLNRRNGFM